MTHSIQIIPSSVTTLHSMLSEAEKNIQTLEPLEQVQELKWLPRVAELLEGLKTKADAFFNKKQDIITSGLTALHELLGECNGLIKKIQTHHDMAIEVLDLSKDVELAFQAKNLGQLNQNTAKSLQERVTQMTEKPLCQGSLLSVQSLQANILELLSQPVQSQSNPSSSTFITPTPSILSDKEIQAEIEESSNVTSFVDQYHDLIELYKSDSIKNFDKVVKFCDEVKEYSLKKGTFIVANNERAIKRILSVMEKAIEESSKVTSFIDQYHALIELYKSDSIENFDKVAKFYDEVKEYSLKKGMFIVANNERAIKRILSAIEKTMGISNSNQKDIEQGPAQISIPSNYQGLSTNSSQPAQENDSAALKDLETIVVHYATTKKKNLY